MATCIFCDKELPDPRGNTCGSCILKSVDELRHQKKREAEEGVDPNFDLSILGTDKTRGDGKTKGQILSQMKLAAFEAPQVSQGAEMKMLKVICTSSKGRNKLVGDLIIRFNEFGESWIPESGRRHIDLYNRYHHNAIVIVEEPKPEAPAEEPTAEEKPQLALKELEPKTSPRKGATPLKRRRRVVKAKPKTEEE